LALFLPGHSLVASRQELSFILFPGAQHPAFIFVRERIILDNILRIFEMPLGICDLVFSLFRHFVTSIARAIPCKYEIASPVPAAATKVSSAPKKQEQHEDNQKQFHDKTPLQLVRERGWRDFRSKSRDFTLILLAEYVG
jgi:hypothetical protein